MGLVCGEDSFQEFYYYNSPFHRQSVFFITFRKPPVTILLNSNKKPNKSKNQVSPGANPQFQFEKPVDQKEKLLYTIIHGIIITKEWSASMSQASVIPNSSTSLYGLLGNPVNHSLSPLIQNRAFVEVGANSIYLAFSVDRDDLPAVLEGVRALKIKGLNVTIPYKEAVLPYLDDISPEAQGMGAVNTILNEGGKLKGYNTDGQGLVQSLAGECNYRVKDKRVVVLGAGGAARGIILTLLQEEVEHITIINRSKERLANLLSLLHPYREKVPFTGLLFSQVNWDEVLSPAHLLIQSTSVGMFPHHQVDPPLPCQKLHQDLLVVDLVYNPLQTVLLTRAQERGCETFGGWGMLLYQGALSFQLWTRKKAPIQAMKEVLLTQLKSQQRNQPEKGPGG